jgi:hypothetical protein
MTYDPKTTPLRPGRVIAVSGNVDDALAMIVAPFIARKFRLGSAQGVSPVKLELGRWFAPYLLWGSTLPSALSGPAKHGIVLIDIVSNPPATSTFTVRVDYAWSAQLFSPIVLGAIAEGVDALSAKGVLVEAGPIIATKGRL